MTDTAESPPATAGPGTTLFTSPAFVLALALLVLNDWVLKGAVGSWLTGKISDFAGLFVFALFWSALLPRWRRTVFAITTAAFLLWKSPVSSPALATWNALVPWPLERIVDYTDWIALAALLPAWAITSEPRAPWPRTLARRVGAVLTGSIAIVAITATSRAVHAPIPNSTAHMVPGDITAVRIALDSMGFRPSRRGSIPTGVADTISMFVRQPPERWVRVIVELKNASPDSASLRVIYALPWSAAPVAQPEDVLTAFDAQVVHPLRDWLAARPTQR